MKKGSKRIDGALDIAAKSLGIESKELSELITDKKIRTGKILPRLASELRQGMAK